MSKQDFAQVKANTKTESGSASGSLLNAIGILVIAGLCFSGGYWLGAGDSQQTGNKTDIDAIEARLAAQVAENKILQAKNEALQDMVLQWKTKAEQGAHTKVGELSFYKELPKQSVTPAPVPDAPKMPPKRTTKPVEAQQVEPVAKPTAAVNTGTRPVTGIGGAIRPGLTPQTSYRIQLASFRTESGAMAMQAKLAKGGFISQIQKVNLGEKGQWHRLYAGPYGSKSAAEHVQQQIEQQLKLKGFILRAK
jgi:cell division septation protein DedD